MTIIIEKKSPEEIKARLEALRAAIRAENISYGELAELQGLADYIEPGDVELLEPAGVPEHGCLTCADCGEKTKNDDFANYITGRDDKAYCSGCYEYAFEYANSCFIFGDDEIFPIEPVYFTEKFGDMENNELPEPVLAAKWVNSDGWRGYSDWDLEPGYVKIVDGWITGYPDETTTRKADIADYFEQLRDGKLIPPFKIWWLIGHTSNVFSSASAIVIEAKNAAAFDAWIRTFNGTTEDLQTKFN